MEFARKFTQSEVRDSFELWGIFFLTGNPALNGRFL